jgi:hypothetical protein
MTDVPTYEKNFADIVAIYGRGREHFRPPTYSKEKLLRAESQITRI